MSDKIDKIDIDKTYRTRDGRAVRILCTDRKTIKYPVVGLVLDYNNVTENLEVWAINGSYYNDCRNESDLVEVSPCDGWEIDENVWVKMDDEGGWLPYHFAGVNENGKPMVWCFRTTSFTADGRKIGVKEIRRSSEFTPSSKQFGLNANYGND